MTVIPSKRTGFIVRGVLYLLIGLAQLYFNHSRASNLFTSTPIYGVLLLLVAAFWFYRATVPDGTPSLFGSQRN